MNRRKKFRILLAPLDICDIFQCLKGGFEELGHRAEFVNLGVAKKQGLASSTPWAIQYFHRKYHAVIDATDAKIIGYASLPKLYANLEFLVARWILLFWMLTHFDVFLFKSGESFWGSCFDQRILRLFGKQILHAFYGSDERPNYLAPDIEGTESPQALYDNVKRKRQTLDFLRQFADITISNPLSAQFQSGQFCITQALGIPIDDEKLSARHSVINCEERVPGHIRILHAPSSPALKGSNVFRNIIRRLKEQDRKIQYIELTGRTNAEVMKEIELCDFVIDELYSDSFAAVFATEALALGKPVIVGGYGLEELTKHIPSETAAPSLYCHPAEVPTVLERLVDDYEFREQSRLAAEAFSDKCSATQVAARFIKLFDGTAPAAWFMNASNVRYVKGVGASEAIIAVRIKKLTEAYGEPALFLEDKPELKVTVLDFANQTKPNCFAQEKQAAT